jgi:hypothetical protein
MRVKSARSIRKGASSGQTAASLVENHARKPPSSALIANHASKPALFEVPYSDSNAQMKIRLVRTVVTKQARLIEMLRRPDGATTAELVKAIRWQVRTPPDWQPLYATASSPRRTVWRTSKPSNCGWSR